jgi:hypothetical protein
MESNRPNCRMTPNVASSGQFIQDRDNGSDVLTGWAEEVTTAVIVVTGHQLMDPAGGLGCLFARSGHLVWAHGSQR